MTLSPRDWQGVHVLTLLESGRTAPARATEALGITRPQLRRLTAKFGEGGPAALVHGNRDRPSPRALPVALRTRVLALAQGSYAGPNDVPLKLTEG